MNDQEMSVVDHLSELRKRIIITMIFFFYLFLTVGFMYTKEIYTFIVKDLPMKLTVLGPSDILWIYFIIASVFSIVCTIPFAALQLWLFVKPALSPNERRATLLYVPALFFLLFAGGLCFGYFVIFTVCAAVLGESWKKKCFNQCLQQKKYFEFVLNMTLPFAVLFELPVIAMFFLTSIGLLNPIALQKGEEVCLFCFNSDCG
ncbi:hypothetical protein GCM10020331_064760 [Ectobacillus funiculus]